MGILLRLRDTKLGEPVVLNDFPQSFSQLLRRVGDPGIHPRLILGHGGKGRTQRFVPGEAGKLLIGEGMGQFPSPIGTEIIEDHAVLGVHSQIAGHHRRNDELVRHAGSVGRRHRGRRALRCEAVAVGDGLVGFRHPLPTLVPIHSVEAARHRGDATHADLRQLIFQFCHIVRRAGRRHVPPVQKGVYPHVGEAGTLSQF